MTGSDEGWPHSRENPSLDHLCFLCGFHRVVSLWRCRSDRDLSLPDGPHGFYLRPVLSCFSLSQGMQDAATMVGSPLAALGAATIAYALLDVDEFIRRSTVPEPVDFFMGVAAIVLLVEISRRVVGNAFTLVLVGFLLYVYFGRFIPGPISHKGYDLDRIVGHMYMTLEGIFGVPLSVSVSFVTLFVVYGTFMDAAGAGNFWLELSLPVMGSSSSSAGRGAVITTALLGGPQGSGVRPPCP